MHKFFICLLFVMIPELWGQTSDDVTIIVNGDSTSITINYNDEKLTIGNLTAPKVIEAELNNDETEELIIVSKYEGNPATYRVYAVSLRGGISIVDSIDSGVREPHVYYSEEIEGSLLVTGYPELDSLNAGKNEYYSPANCLVYDGEKIYSINEDVYTLFNEENEELLKELDNKEIRSGCEFTRENSALIASIYINFVNAGEVSMAGAFLKNYYICTDYIEFKAYLTNLLGL
ncbi:MAG: hypothetical protein GX452_02915 [Ignavibacteriales bacterium]|nr:hypothetical protein [Ignavibacteriaceae bacterium]NLH60339.1 hypothetical protein [Ignavibacteriales bacterium]HOJ18126.1 hypothetical protein [Ignavibacteriaceae bacterium]HPO56665.1 hypothetical protein [Ignavibacteriaceae bacterium]